MDSYETLARFYDPIMGDQKESARDVYNLIKKFHTKPDSVLELACGTGSYIHYLSKYYDVTGVDSSSAMLSIAREKMPDATLIQNDMLSFEFDEKYDSVICMNDSVNHLLKIDEWKKLFSQAHKHLNKNGIFIFDINTEKKLKNISESSPIVHEFNDNIFITDVVKNAKQIFEWNLRIFEKINDQDYKLHEKTLLERAVPIVKIKEMLSKHFRKIQLFDFDNLRVSQKSERIHFIALKK